MKKMLDMYVMGLLAFCFMLSACGGSSSSSSTSKDSSQAGASVSDIKLVKQWETDTSLRTPESVLWDSAQNRYFVSNIDGDAAKKDHNGFLSTIDPDGKILDLHWVDGMDAPKGMGMYNGELYAADVDSLVIVDIKTAQIKTKVFVPGAVFLNDIAVGNNGEVYISDTRKGKVFLYQDGKVSTYLSAPEVKDANGLLVWKGKLWIDAADGTYSYDFNTHEFALHSDAVKGGDGLTFVNDSDLIASRWVGEVFYVFPDGKAVKLLDTKDAGSNTADIYFSTDKDQLLIPTFKGNRVVAYKLQH